MLFYIPTVFSIGAVFYFWYGSDMDLKWKVLVTALVLASIAFQVVPPVRTHFLVPLLMQVFVCLWMIFHQKLQ